MKDAGVAYDATSGMYVGMDETTRSIVLHDGVNYNFANLGRCGR